MLALQCDLRTLRFDEELGQSLSFPQLSYLPLPLPNDAPAFPFDIVRHISVELDGHDVDGAF
ncbi:MAG: hypothetical protein WCG27_13060 [Pseudomonadota bacterium]